MCICLALAVGTYPTRENHYQSIELHIVAVLLHVYSSCRYILAEAFVPKYIY